MMTKAEIERLKRIENAAKTVVMAAWTDRWSRLHGHPTIMALELLLKTSLPDETPPPEISATSTQCLLPPFSEVIVAGVHEEGRDGFFAERGCPYPSTDPRFDIWWEGYNEAQADTEAGDGS